MEENVNWGRVVLGGLGAGLVFNLILLWPGLRLTRLLRAIPQGDAAVFATVSVVLIFLLTTLMLWLYAELRRRIKAGLAFAAVLGASLGVVMSVLQFVGWKLALHQRPGHAWLLNALATTVLLGIASLFGAWIYNRPSS